jgi:plastocyanin
LSLIDGRHPRRVVTLLAVLLVVLVGCEDGTGNGTDAADPGAADTDEASDEDPAGATVSDDEAPEVPDDADPVWADELRIADGAFEPEFLLYAPDRELVVRNDDDVAHTVTAWDGTFDVRVEPGETAELVTPAEPGWYRYACEIHPDMRGAIDLL